MENLGSTPHPVTVANEGLQGFPIKNVIFLVVTVTGRGVDPRKTLLKWMIWGFSHIFGNTQMNHYIASNFTNKYTPDIWNLKMREKAPWGKGKKTKIEKPKQLSFQILSVTKILQPFSSRKSSIKRSSF